MEEITLAEYIAANNPSEAKRLLNEYGTKVKSFDDMIYKLNQLQMKMGKDGLAMLVDIHPDKDLIMQFAGSNEASSSCDGDSKCAACAAKQHSNACGCSAMSSFDSVLDRYSSFDGGQKNAERAESSFSYVLPVVAMTSLALVVVALKLK